MPRLTQADLDSWQPLGVEYAAVILDFTVAEFAQRFGWKWDSAEEDGLGVIHSMGLLWDGESRYLLQAADLYPANGIAVSVAQNEDLRSARQDFLEALELPQAAVLAIVENDQWYARWDFTNARDRVASAPQRWFDL